MGEKVMSRVVLCAALLVGVQGWLPSVAAEEGQAVRSRAIEEVVVTARKRGESIQDVPVAVTAFSETQVEDLFLRDMTDLSGHVPNMLITGNNSTPHGGSIFIRGIGTQDVEKSFDPAVGVFVDGVYTPSVANTNLDMFDYESVEILRGPQGQLFGKNTTGGAIVIRRTKPTMDWEGKVSATVGSEDRRDFKGRLNFPLIEDKLGGKVTFFSFKSDGQLNGVAEGRDVGRRDSQAMTATLLAVPVRNLELEFTYERYDDDSDGPTPANIAFAGIDPNQNVLECLLPGFAHCPQIGEDQDGRSIKNIHTTNPDSEFEMDLYTLNATWFLDFGTIKSITGYRDQDETLNLDFDGIAEDFFTPHRTAPEETFSQELQLNTTLANGAVDLVAGVYYYDSEYELLQQNKFFAEYLFVPVLADFGDPTPYAVHPCAGTHGCDVIQGFEQSVESWSIYAQFDWRVTDRLTLTLGGRYIDEKKSVTGYNGLVNAETVDPNNLLYPTGATGAPVPIPAPPLNAAYDFLTNVIGVPPAAVSGLDLISALAACNIPAGQLSITGEPMCWSQVTDASESWTDFTPKIGAYFEVNDDVMVYGSWTKGFRSGGFNGRNSAPQNIGPFDPEDVEQYEIGLKSQFADQTVRLNLAGFYTDYQNKQEEIIRADPDLGSVTVIDNVASMEIKGLEGEFIWSATDSLTLNGSVGWLDAEYDEFVADLLGTGVEEDNSDLEPRRVPKWQYSLTGSYLMEVAGGSLNANLMYRWIDQWQPNLQNFPPGAIDDQQLLDASLVYERRINNLDWTFRLFGRNLTNEDEYYTGAVMALPVFAFSGVNPNERTWGLEVMAAF